MKIKIQIWELPFTLIELLIVIAIMAILASLLLPSLQKAKEAGRRISCIGNFKSVSYGINSYSDEYNDWIIFMGNSFKPYYSGIDHIAVILGLYPDEAACHSAPKRDISHPDYPYPAKLIPFVCPSKKTWFKDVNSAWLCMNYTYTGKVMVSLYEGADPQRKRSSFATPSRLLLLADGKCSTASNNYTIGDNNLNINFSDTRCTLDAVHNKMANMLFLDGHTNSVKDKGIPDVDIK